MILSNIKNFEPNAGNRKFEQGRQAALKKEQELLDRLKQIADGEQKAKETKRMVDLIRNFTVIVNIQNTAWLIATSFISRLY
jgi:pyruvate,water dikinase